MKSRKMGYQMTERRLLLKRPRWTEFCEMVLNEFKPKNSIKATRTKMAELIQGDKSVSDEKALDRFERGLKVELKVLEAKKMFSLCEQSVASSHQHCLSFWRAKFWRFCRGGCGTLQEWWWPDSSYWHISGTKSCNNGVQDLKQWLVHVKNASGTQFYTCLQPHYNDTDWSNGVHIGFLHTHWVNADVAYKQPIVIITTLVAVPGLNQWYNSSMDALVHPSLQTSLPNTSSRRHIEYATKIIRCAKTRSLAIHMACTP